MTTTEMYLHLAKTNSKQYNILKTAEELAELQEVLLKRLTKEGGPKEPTDQSIIEEIGDVKIRLEILSRMLGQTKVKDRIEFKTRQYKIYIKAGKYCGKI